MTQTLLGKQTYDNLSIQRVSYPNENISKAVFIRFALLSTSSSHTIYPVPYL